MRTIEDGSTRLRYGGIPEDGVCPQTGTNVNITENKFNKNDSDNAYIGYMYGDTSSFQEIISSTIPFLSIGTSSNYYYATSYERNVSNQFYLTGTKVSGKWNTESICTSSICPVANYYTCKSTSSSGKCTTLYKILSYGGSSYANVNRVTYSSKSYELAHQNINDSNIKKLLDAWYSRGTVSDYECIPEYEEECDFPILETKLINNSLLIADTPYCNDRSIGIGGKYDWEEYTELGYGPYATLYKALRRLGALSPDNQYMGGEILNPTYKCSQNNDKFTLKTETGGTSGYGNNALNYPIGLLTADEVSYAGSSYFLPADNYLYTDEPYWLMTPSFIGPYNESVVFTINSYTELYRYSVDSIIAVVPAISLKPTATVSSGIGTYENPYIIE